VVAIKLYAGIDGSLIDAAVANGATGVVLECFGVGNANHSVVEAVRGARRAGTVVVCVSRCPAGTVAPVYGNGGGVDLADAGAIFGGNLSGQKARVLLMAALGCVEDPADVAAILEPHLRC
jgi:L-asparaginase